MNIRGIIKKTLPKWGIKYCKYLKIAFKLLPETYFWFKNDVTKSSSIRDEKSVLSGLMVVSHVLEKGITMPNRRLGFGFERVRHIIISCQYAIQCYSENHIEIQSTLKDLEQYIQIHQEADYSLPVDIVDGINKLMKFKRIDTKNCYSISADQYFNSTSNFKEFAFSRHSVRWYDNKNIDHNTIHDVIELAKTAPSACNRQSTKVYVIENAEKKKLILELQNGNRGFGDKANKILLLTSDMRYWNYKYRTSAYLDTGIFTMNLLYALHYYKICACTLNAHLSKKQRKELKKIVGYSKSEMPVVFISIGYAPPSFMVAGSQRLETDRLFTIV